jgi:hypothetical protein
MEELEALDGVGYASAVIQVLNRGPSDFKTSVALEVHINLKSIDKGVLDGCSLARTNRSYPKKKGPCCHEKKGIGAVKAGLQFLAVSSGC